MKKYTIKNFILKAKSVHGDKYDYSKVEYKGEEKIEKILLERGIRFEKEKTFDSCKNIRKLPFYFFLPDYNIFIEYQGVQHEKYIEFLHRKRENFVSQLRRDDIKRNYAESNGTFVKVTYLDNVEELIMKALSLLAK